MSKYSYIYKKKCSNCDHQFSPANDKITEDSEEIDMPPYFKAYVTIWCSVCKWGMILDESPHLDHD